MRTGTGQPNHMVRPNCDYFTVAIRRDVWTVLILRVLLTVITYGGAS